MSSPELIGFHRKSREDRKTLSPDLEMRYQRERRAIKAIYEGVGLWHGTGRYESNGSIDVLSEIAAAGELRPHQDIWDGTLRDTQTISATKSRPYATVYSDVHLQAPADELLFKDNRKTHLMRLTAPHILSLIPHIPYILGQKQVARAWMERKTGQKIGKKVWQQAIRFGALRSIVPGDYPILIGIAHDAFTPIQTAGYISATETRTDQSIPISKITHIEVPLKYVEETQELLQQNETPLFVLPRELGERYSTEFTDWDLVTGKGFVRMQR